VAAVLLLACAVSGQNLNVGSARQFQSADGAGQASFGYSHPGQASVTHRDHRGNQMGSYAYISPDGEEIRVSYIADEQGFRIVSNDQVPISNAPAVPVLSGNYIAETPEVAAARAEHMAALARAAAANGVPQNTWSQQTWTAPAPVQQTWSAPAVSQQRWDLPAPVGYTAEVAAERAAFFAAYNAAAKAAAENPEPEQTWSAPAPIQKAAPIPAPVQQQTWTAPAPVQQTWASTPVNAWSTHAKLGVVEVDTPEVRAAKLAFFEAYNAASRAAAENPEK